MAKSIAATRAFATRHLEGDRRYGARPSAHPCLTDRAQGVELTESGRLLLARGRVIFDELSEGVKDIQHLSDPTRGEIRVGTTEPITDFVAGGHRAGCRRAYPRHDLPGRR